MKPNFHDLGLSTIIGPKNIEMKLRGNSDSFESLSYI